MISVHRQRLLRLADGGSSLFAKALRFWLAQYSFTSRPIERIITKPLDRS